MVVVRDDTATVKQWLRELRRQAGLSQRDVAAAVGVSLKTIHNAEAADQGMPAGLTMLRMLREYGAVADAPVGDSPLEARLRSLEEKVRETVDLTREALVLLAASRLDTEAPARSPRAS